MESVAWKNITVGVCWDLMCRRSSISFFARNFPTPWRGKFAFWPHPCFYAPLYPPLKVWILSCGLTQTGQKCLEIRLLGNFPVSQVPSCRYTLLAWNLTLPSVLLGVRNTYIFPSNLSIEVTTHRESQIKVKVLKSSSPHPPPPPIVSGKRPGNEVKAGTPLFESFVIGKTCFHTGV